MHLVKPAWVQHTDEKRKRVCIFSVHVHPDGSRLATGGLDTKVRIWSTAPIYDENSTMPKSLSTLTMHIGPVLCVRWSNSGRLLASGSDDGLVMIWDLDPGGAGKVFGEEDVNVEGWKALKRLAGHESDVQDLAWSPNDRFLASVGLDSLVYIWCGYTFERLRKLSGHVGYVKGICWDPVGEYLATQSDDKSVRIWRTTDWGLHAVVTEPFQNSPGSTYFRRLSWSPDGAHITASNAMNGPVFVAAVIERKDWTSDISLVGHENTVEVASYNPHIFVREPGKRVDSSNIFSVLALGADDRSVSVWRTSNARPIIVAKEVFDRNVFDLCWSSDGMNLFACSSDGSIAVFEFDADELEGLAPHEIQQQYLKGYNFDSPMTSGMPQHPQYLQPIPGPPPAIPVAQPANTAPMLVIRDQQVVTRTKEGKRRIKPVFISQIGSGQYNGLQSGPVMNGVPHQQQQPQYGQQQQQQYGQPQPNGLMHSGMPQQMAAGPSMMQPGMQQDHNPFMSAPIQPPQNSLLDDDILMVDGWGGDADETRAAAAASSPSVGKAKGRTLGGDRQREIVAVRQIRPAENGGASSSEGDMGGGGGRGQNMLVVPALQTVLTATVEGKEGDILEARNAEDDSKPTEIAFVSGKQTQWMDYLPAPVLALVATTPFSSAACDDKSLNVYSSTGRRLLPTIILDSKCSFLEASKSYLMAVSSTGMLHVWNIKTGKAMIAGVSIAHFINANLMSATLKPNGAPVLNFTGGTSLSYDISLASWVKLADHWWSQGSDEWNTRAVRTAANKAAQVSKGPVAGLEANISDLRLPDVPFQEKPQWWSAAITLGHLESRQHAARALESPREYKDALLLYAKRIADEGFRGKAEELIKELSGPLYWRPGREEAWCSTVLGMQKRDLLKEVLGTFARSRTLVTLATEYQELMKKAAREE